MKTINRTWFKNQLRKGNFVYKCLGKYTDDYAYDADVKFHRMDEFKPAEPNLFDDWYISTIRIYGNKEGIIHVNFAGCEDYEFKIKK